jgi:RNA polymerase sigma factor, sigma-70 family
MHFRRGERYPSAVEDFTVELLAEPEQTTPLRQQLHAAIQEELTPRQLEMIWLYYGKGITMEEVSRQLGVNKSTVSRTIRRGEARLSRCLKYGSARLLKAAKLS